MFDTGVDCFFSLLDFLSVHVFFIGEGVEVFFEASMPNGSTVEFGFFHDKLVESRGAVDNVFADNFGLTFLVLDVTFGVLDFGVEFLNFKRHVLEVIVFASKEVNPFLNGVELIVKIGIPEFIGGLFIFEQHEDSFRVFTGRFLLILVNICIRLTLHMIEHFLINFLETGPEFLILFPDLSFVHFVVVGEFGHVFVALGVGELGSGGDVGEDHAACVWQFGHDWLLIFII